MHTGKPSISRGRGLSGPDRAGPRLSIVARAPAAPEPSISPEYQAVHDRLSSLERLARLREQGALTDEEFAAEKAAILGPAPDELILNEPLLAPEPPRPPTLLGRLFGWRIIPVGILAGLALSYA